MLRRIIFLALLATGLWVVHFAIRLAIAICMTAWSYAKMEATSSYDRPE